MSRKPLPFVWISESSLIRRARAGRFPGSMPLANSIKVPSISVPSAFTSFMGRARASRLGSPSRSATVLMAALRVSSRAPSGMPASK